MQLTIDDAIRGPAEVPKRLVLEIVHAPSGQRKTVYLIERNAGFIVVEWPLVGLLRFRARMGLGVSNARGWSLPKTEIAKVLNAT